MKGLKLSRTAVLAVLFFLAANILVNENVEAKQKEIASSLVRFHVRANSDSPEDQELKLKVRDAVVEEMEMLLKDSESVEESLETIEQNMEHILTVASQTVRENGYQLEVSGYITEEYFPLRIYGDVDLPPGRYTAFRIDLGAFKYLKFLNQWVE